MSAEPETANLALFCDFENIALGVRDERYAQLDIRRVLERLLLKGSIVVKKAYCDWERYKEFKAGMHHAGFELIEIPHVKQSGKNSADIRMVVDALDLCYTKPHVDTFVIISGDSDFSPLVAKLRENNKGVIGLGVKNSTSDLLIASCDEFIYYDDLVREQKSRRGTRRKTTGESAASGASAAGVGPSGSAVAGSASSETSGAEPASAGSAGDGREREEDRKQEAFDLVLATVDALLTERGEDGRVWGSMVKQALKRVRPGFNESYYGFRSFNRLLEEAAAKRLLTLERDDKSGGYLIHTLGDPV
ncbi:MAG: NYN domain-containing protein [Steroidobacteraceae bacterium]